LFVCALFETDRRDCTVSFKSPLSFDGSAPKLDFGFTASGGGGVSAKLSMSLDELVKSNKAAAKAVPAGKSRETKALDKAAQTKEKRNKAVAEKRGVAPVPTATPQPKQTKQKDGKPTLTTSNQRKRAREKKKRAEERAQRAAAADAAGAAGAGAAGNGGAAAGAGAKQRPQKPKQTGGGQQQQPQQQSQQQQQQQQRQKSITIQVKNDRAAPAGGNKHGDRKPNDRGAPKANGGGAKLQQKQQERVVRHVSTTKDARQKLHSGARQQK
jgi:hypothetical protein